MSMAKWFFIALALLIIVAVLFLPTPTSTVSVKQQTNDDAPPVLFVPPWVDTNNNSISDALDQEIANKTASGHGDDYVGVTVMLAKEPSYLDLVFFTAAGGNVTAGPWRFATYGFGGSIQYDKIDIFAQNRFDVILIEKIAKTQVYD